MSTLAPFRLQPTFSARTWGRPDLAPWFLASALPQSGAEPIGEAWLTGPESTVAEGPNAGETLASLAQSQGATLLGDAADAAEFPLLVKLLFPNDKLSVQVHPNDTEAQALGEGRGKTECWYVLEAEPGATVACGLQPGITVDHLKASIADGSMERLLNHVPVSAGDLVFVDAGTVHAIGPGVTILEIQQTSDITYRLFDYGRPRELHLEKGLAVSKAETRAGKVAPQPIPHGKRLIQEQYFTVDSFPMRASETILLEDAKGKPQCFVALRGDAEIVVNDVTTALPSSSAVVIPASAGAVTIKATNDVEVVRATP
ncbi:MAG: type I phosphomannose isomerase catalytic subunit [Janthinobacterium lividum]